MLKTYAKAMDDTAPHGAAVFWIDLLSPTPEEVARVTADFGIQVPARSLQEIETSSRLRAEGPVLYVSMPLASQNEAAGFAPVPLGFILSPQLLVTVRYSEIHAFGPVQARVEAARLAGSAVVFAALIDGMVDFAADMLEKSSTDLAAVSAAVFGPHDTRKTRDKRGARALRESLSAVGIGEITYHSFGKACSDYSELSGSFRRWLRIGCCRN